MISNSSLLRRAAAVIFFVSQLSRLPVARCSFDLYEFDQKCNALLKVANYLVNRPHQMNVDGLFGITLAEANLIAALNHPNIKFIFPSYIRLMRIILQCLDRARLNMKITVHPENEEVGLMNEILTEPTLWIRPILWKRGALGSRPSKTTELDNTNVSEKLIARGSPQEKESDSCISQLIQGALKKQCKPSDDCAEMLMRMDNPAGYPLTHRLLYVQIARALNCPDDGNISYSQLTEAYCKEILQDLVDIEANEFPGVSRDLALEQVLLCGMEGYMDFGNDHYAQLFRSWAHPAGCYNAKGFDNSRNFSHRTRRSSGPMDFGCDNHASGLAVGSLALLVREEIENAFQPPFNYDENND